MPRRACFVALFLIVSGCAPRAPDGPLEVRSVSAQAFASAPDFEDRVRAAAADGARWWGADVAILDGWSVVVFDGGIECGSVTAAGGCTVIAEREIRVSTELGPCVDLLPLAHEVGHVALWRATGDVDGRHADPRWATLASETCTRIAARGACP
jgi:hypothetical protein